MARSEAGKTLPFPSILVEIPSASNSSTVRSTLRARRAGPRNGPFEPESPLNRPRPERLAGIVGGIDGTRNPPKAPEAARVRQVAPGSARHQDFDARAAVLLQDDRAEAPLGRSDRGEEGPPPPRPEWPRQSPKSDRPCRQDTRSGREQAPPRTKKAGGGRGPSPALPRNRNESGSTTGHSPYRRH